MNNVQRYERVDSYPGFSNAVTDSYGFMQDSPIVARTGVYTYLNPDGSIRREYRPPEEVFSLDSLNSFKGKPITVGHPKAGKVTSKTASKLSIGSILSEGYPKEMAYDEKSDRYVGCDIVLHNPDAIGDDRELSLGYRCDLEEVGGTAPNGERYDAIQRNIRVNHLAVVKKARAGVKARLNCDGDEFIVDESEEQNMSKFKLDGMEFDLPDTVISHINAMEQRADAAESNVVAMKTLLDNAETEIQEKVDAYEELSQQLDGMAGEKEALALKNDELEKEIVSLKAQNDVTASERDGIQAKLDAAIEEKEAAVAKAKEETKAEMAERAELEKLADKAKVSYDADMSNKDMKVAIIKSVRKDFTTEGKSEGYLDGAFDAAKESLRTDSVKEQMKQAKGLGEEQKQDAADAPKSAEDHRLAMIARQREAYNGENHKF